MVWKMHLSHLSVKHNVAGEFQTTDGSPVSGKKSCRMHLITCTAKCTILDGNAGQTIFTFTTDRKPCKPSEPNQDLYQDSV